MGYGDEDYQGEVARKVQAVQQIREVLLVLMDVNFAGGHWLQELPGESSKLDYSH